MTILIDSTCNNDDHLLHLKTAWAVGDGLVLSTHSM